MVDLRKLRNSLSLVQDSKFPDCGRMTSNRKWSRSSYKVRRAQFTESLKISKIVLRRRSSHHCNDGEPAFSASVDSDFPHLRLFVVPWIFKALRPYTTSVLILCQQPYLVPLRKPAEFSSRDVAEAGGQCFRFAHHLMSAGHR